MYTYEKALFYSLLFFITGALLIMIDLHLNLEENDE